MTTIDRYIHAATRANTRKAYRGAIQHFEVEWGGFLPATADSIAQYLVDHASTLAINTLRLRLAGIAQWHVDQGFPDPTKAPHVRKVLKGISELHPVTEKRARPLQLEQLTQVVSHLDQQISDLRSTPEALQPLRDKALLLIGFWRAFRSDELARIQADHIDAQAGKGMDIYLPRSKGDRSGKGRYFKAPALKKLCPVEAYLDWVSAASIKNGPVFRAINRWGQVAEKGLHPSSIIGIIRACCRKAGIENAQDLSSHSLRRGFAGWANDNRWDIKSLMEYVGWRDAQSAMRYIEAPDPFARHRIEVATAMADLPDPSSGSQ